MVCNPNSAAISGNKRKVREFCSTKKRRITDEDSVSQKRPKACMSWSKCKQNPVKTNGKSSMVETRRIRLVEDEEVAVGLTKLRSEDHPPCRKLMDFIFHDADGNPQFLEMSEIEDLFITAHIMPLNDTSKKAKGRGVKCVAFGRIESWAISGYDEGSPVVWISTEIADYECVKPSSCYKCYYDHFYEKAQISIEVYQKLARSAGGNPDLSLAELVAAVVRSMNRSKSSCSEFIGRDFVICLGHFIYNQLIGLDETSERNDARFSTLPTLLALGNECRNRTDINKCPVNASCGILKTNDAQPPQIIEDDDQKRARLLHEWENWILMRQERTRQSTTSPSLCTAEIANYYPLPAYYQPSAEEMDEYVIFENDASMHCLEPPRRVLDNWSLYDSDSMFVPLELLLMKPWDEVDLTVYGSGIIKYDEETGFCHGTEPGQSSPNSLPIEDSDGFPICLSALKKWRIKKFEPSKFFISIQTDVARYWLGKPAKQYIQWYEPVHKTAKLVMGIITLLRAQSRLSKLSFADVLKRLTEFDNNHPAFISSNLVLVESYMLVHGHFILQLFSKFPDKEIQKCAFVSSLSHKMQERHHAKPFREKKIVVRTKENLNASAAGRVLSKRNLMRATTTRLINGIWGDYYLHYFPNYSEQGDTQEFKKLELEKQEDNEEESLEEKTSIEQEKLSKPCPSIQQCNLKSRHGKVIWKGEPTVKTGCREAFYRYADVHEDQLAVGGAAVIGTNESEDTMTIVFLEYMFEKDDGMKMAHGRILLKSSETILNNAGNEREVFLTNDCVDFKLADVKETLTVEIRLRSWGHKHRASYSNADKIDLAKAEENKKKGLPMEYYCKSLYWPERGAFFSLPFDSMGLGNGICSSCKQRNTQEDQFAVSSKNSFSYKKTQYSVHDFVYVRPFSFGMEKDKQRTVKGGRIVGLKPYTVCHLLGVEVAKRKGATPESTFVKVRRFYRPEDVSADETYTADVREVYYSEDIFSVSVEMLEGKCEVRKKNDLPNLDFPVITQHVFFCEKIYDAVNKCLNKLPAKHKFVISLNRKASHTSSRMITRGRNCDVEPDDCGRRKDLSKDGRLVSLDIFSGCGGLSEGLHQSGVSLTKWAIEYEQSAGEAFSKNHPDTLVFIDNCNVILRAIMEKCGDADDCISTSEATKLAAELSKEKLNNLPLPGQVDFIYGGPPCQGFSSMNRFNQGIWSKVQCEMILAFLSFVEYFRPRFFLLENVRTFVSFNKGHTFRLTLASLLEMGYQVRFGVLDAGSYGVAQSRKRAFIWAASPEEKLPEWPEPMHVVAGSELKIFLPNGKHYSAVRSTAGGAPFRALTVKDTIGDLPPVENGASELEIKYAAEPVSWFQKQIRGGSLILKDHIAKSMNELNLRRCQLIPKHIGADWRELPDEKVELSDGQISDLRPTFLVKTANRHGQWKGLFGRLGWEGNFPTSTTDPNPTHKVGMCLHPNQDRIVTVRESARSQGFPDTYTFTGKIHHKYRQIGNAVPPTLAYALGRKLKEAVCSKIGDR